MKDRARKALILILVIVVKVSYFFVGALKYEEFDLGILKRNDSFWYEQISTKGYAPTTSDKLGNCDDIKPTQTEYAFFPLYPAFIGSLTRLTGASFNLIAFIYSLFSSGMAFMLFYVFTSKFISSTQVAFWSTLILIIFPFNFYFSTYYTESTYLLLLLASFISLSNQRLGLLALFASLLVLTRPNGLLMLVPLFVYHLEQTGQFSYSGIRKYVISPDVSIVAFGFPVLVFAGYCWFLYSMTGDFFAYKTAQSGWCKESVLPFVPILRVSGVEGWFRLIYLVGFATVAVFHLRKLSLSLNLLIWINLLLPLLANSITLPRFISTIFVFFILFGQSLSQKSLWIKLILITVLFTLQLCSFYLWLESSKLSY